MAKPLTQTTGRRKEAVARVRLRPSEGEGNGKIVIVIDGTSTGMLGDTLTYISTLDGVIAANMVFEHVDTEETSGDEQRTDAA